MCGIVGVIGTTPVNQLIYDALLLLQHRGQDAAGIVTEQERKFFIHKARGMVKDVFRTRNMRALPGRVGLGQVRYPTTGSASKEEEVQPFYVNAPFGLVMAHNGNITNARRLRRQLFDTDHRHTNTESDSEVLLNVFAHELARASDGQVLSSAHIFGAITAMHQRLKGSYSVVALIAGYGMVAFRDPFGIRPLCLGQSADGAVMVASESVALESSGFPLVGDIAPGEAVFVGHSGKVERQLCAAKAQRYPCIFEYIYLARPDSVMEGISVYRARLQMGEALAKRVISCVPPSQIDAIIPVPESSRPSAMQLAHRLGLPYREGFVKNRYVGRTFIMPGQATRKKSVRQKLNAISSEFQGRNVLLVDDSIVRGTTSKEIVQMARDAGAAKVYLASAAPPVRHPNVYGIDMPTREELIAHNRNEEEIRRWIGCDALIYQDLEAMRQALAQLNPQLMGFEASCFDDYYITGDISDEAPPTPATPAVTSASAEDFDDLANSLSLPNFSEHP